MCCVPFSKRQPSQSRAAPRLVRAVEAVREDRLRHVHLDATDRVDELLEPVEVDDDDVVDGQPGQRLHRRERERRAAHLVRRVDLRRPVAGNLHAEIARNREVRDAVGPGIEMEEQQRIGAVGIGASRSSTAVRTDDEDGRRLGEERTVALGELRLRVLREPRVRLVDAARNARYPRAPQRTARTRSPTKARTAHSPQRRRRFGAPGACPGCVGGREVLESGTLPFLRPPRYSR